ncbi:YceI family protein [Limibacter armeniacum]|uniref:YceI family protein n=1 Tax=Limibacter armeniacum TaxID=466084 RepID=UPI002FE57A57
MIRILIISLLLLSGSYSFAQQRMLSKTGKIHFTSDAPLELIEASSNSLKGILEMPTRKFAFSVPIKSFQGFNSALQQQHFNENYMESDEFPKATFTGKIIEKVDFSQPGTYQVRAKGKLNIHGVEQSRIFKVKLKVDDTGIHFSSKLTIPLSDHNISIPQIVHQKIATEIDVDLKGTLLKPQQ